VYSIHCVLKLHRKKTVQKGFSITLILTLFLSCNVYNNSLKERIGLISYNSCTDYDAFKLFLHSTFEKINQAGIKDLIIDVRNNSGGNSSLNDLLIAFFTDKKYRQSSKRLWK